MKYMKLVLVVIILLILGAVGFGVKGTIKSSSGIPQKWIEGFKNAQGEEKSSLKNQIVHQILRDAQKSEWMNMVDGSNLDIIYGDLLGDQKKEAIMVVAMGPKNSIIAVYEDKGITWEYVHVVDTFFQVKNIQMIPIKESGKEILVVREYADQMTGAFEISTFIRAYAWKRTDFALVLNILEDYRAYWNELWDEKKPKEESRWLRIMQNSNLQWENSMYPVIRTLDRQTYGESKASNTTSIPADGDFEVIEIREIPQVYYWSSAWQHFILGEATDARTGKKIAIIEDLSNAPFGLIGYDKNQYRIKQQDGTVEIVDKSQIKSIKTMHQLKQS